MRKMSLVRETTELGGWGSKDDSKASVHLSERRGVVIRKEGDQVSDVDQLYLACLELALYPRTTWRSWLSCQPPKFWDYSLRLNVSLGFSLNC